MAKTNRKRILQVISMIAVIFSGGLERIAVGQAVNGITSFPMISAHRGASHAAPENTLAAFSKAIEMGANFIEMDVRTTADGIEVIMHDGSLKRTTGLDVTVDKISFNEIRKLSAGLRFGKSFEDQKVPTLEEVCRLVSEENKGRNNPVRLYVDCKAIKVDEVIRLLNQYNLLDSAVFYGSVNTLMEIKNIFGNARVMPAYPGKEEMENTVNKLKPFAFDIPYNRLDAETVALCHAHGIKVFSDLLWIFDKPRKYRKAIRLQIDLIQTDKISSVLKVYKKESLRK